jgi:hypothetical protein
MKILHTAFGETREVSVDIYQNGTKIEATEYDQVLWVEREEDWYALISPKLRKQKVAVVIAQKWRDSENNL